jgi:hypothetical protein
MLRLEYIELVKSVVAGLRGISLLLERQFADAAEAADNVQNLSHFQDCRLPLN